MSWIIHWTWSQMQIRIQCTYQVLCTIWFNRDCVESVHIPSCSGPHFHAFGMNTDQKNCKYGHFLRSARIRIPRYFTEAYYDPLKHLRCKFLWKIVEFLSAFQVALISTFCWTAIEQYQSNNVP